MSGPDNLDNVFGNSVAWINHSRLSRLLLSGGTRVLRELFDSIISPENLANILRNSRYDELMEMKKRGIITLTEWELLFPSSGFRVSSKSWDFILILKLLRGLCSLPPPATGWNSLPDSSDSSLSADLARLMSHRNMIAHPDPSYLDGELTNEEFKRLWGEIKTALLRIVHFYAPSSVEAWENAIDKLVNDEAEAETTTTPPEILTSSPEALKAYKEALIGGKTKNRRALVTIVGPPRAGKTSLLKTLKGEEFDHSEESTTGVVLQKAFCKPRENSWLEKADDGKDDSSKIRIVECIAQKLENSPENKGKTLIETTATSFQIPEERHTREKDLLEDEEHIVEESVLMEDKNLQRSIFNEISQIPKEIQDLLRNYFRDSESGQRSNENEISLKTLDFAGQQVYDAILPLFMSPKSIYILVFNLENDLLSDAQPKVKHGDSERELENPFQMTHLDNQEFWLSCISSYTKKEVASIDRTKVALPPVFAVCTHADVCKVAPKRVAQNLCKILTHPENPYGKHVVPNVYSVDNTISGNKEVKDESAKRLKRDVEELSKLLPHVNEDIPVSWLLFEEELSQLVDKEEKNYINLEEAMMIANNCNVNTAANSMEFTTLLNYLHDLKTIIYFEETRTVFIDTQWLVDMFVKVITVMPFEEWKGYADYWRKLEDKGILHRTLVEHVWSDIASDGQNTVDSLLLIMEKFSLICPWRLNEEEVYLVPCMLCNSRGTEDIEMLLADQKSSTLVIRFKSVHLPMGIFPRLFVALAEHGKKEWTKVSLPKLRPNFCRMFNVGEEGRLDICITSGIRTICMTVCNKSGIDGPTVTKFCQSVRKLLDQIFDGMQNTCPRVENMEIEYGIRCPVCAKCETKCSSHNTKGCKRDSCLHFVREEELKHDRPECHEDDTNPNPLIREETYSHWFPKTKKRSKDQVETNHFEEASNGSSDSRPRKKQKVDSKTCFATSEKELDDLSEEISIWKGLGRKLGVGNKRMEEMLDSRPRKRQKVDSKTCFTPSEKELDDLAEEISLIWKRLGRKLEVDNNKIEEISRDNINYPDTTEKAYQMLLFWRESSQHASCGTLGNALIDLGKRTLAQKYCGMS